MAAAALRALLLILFHSFLVSLILHPVLASVTCVKEERDALIEFKKHLSDPGNKLSSWVGEDCCAWRGIGCNIRTGHVTQLNLRGKRLDLSNSLGGKVSSSLLYLKHLMFLDLSQNSFMERIPEFFGSFQHLRYLNLSWGWFSGEIPHQLGNLSKLQYLDLSGNYLKILKTSAPSIFGLNSLTTLALNDCFLSTIPAWVCTLGNLKYLDMGRNSLEGRIPGCFSNLSHITYLDLSQNNFDGPIPLDSLDNLAFLEELNMAHNNLSGIIPSNIGYFNSLKVLDLSFNHLFGIIPSKVGHLSSLEVLDLSYTYLKGSIPTSLGNLCNLKELNLDGNNLEGGLNTELSGTCITKSLQLLSLSNSQLKGNLPCWLTECQNLHIIDFHNNSFSGTIPSSLGKLLSLRKLWLKDNNLTGSIPKSLGLLSQLEVLDVSNNNYLEGTLNETLFTNLSSLLYLDTSNTSLVWNVSSDWNPPFQLTILLLSPCTLGPHFPTWLLTQINLDILDISRGSIEDVVPNNFWNIFSSMFYLNMSHNRLRGHLPNVLNITQIDLSHNCFEGPILINFLASAVVVDISSNLISGHMPMDIKSKGVFQLAVLNLSNNRITGRIPVSLCEETMIKVLLLSMNQLSGAIPDCWLSHGELEYVDLSRNNLNGEIPTTFGNLSRLASLHLSNNNLSGEISPMLLTRLPQLRVLDLGGNKLVGKIPSNLGEKLPNLMVLRLQSNMLSGNIPPDITHIASLQVLDLAQNNLSGHIPESLKNFDAMKDDVWNKRSGRNFLSENTTIWSSYYDEKVMIATKGGEWLFGVINNILSSIDLSQNNLSGKIPDGLTDLVGLINVNLSKNHLMGKIPDRIGDLKQLESLDLSQNQLHGRIPNSLVDLHFLASMNLSYNNLSGRIPQGSQIQTLDNPSIYVGNRELCGPLIRKQCQEDKTAPQPLSQGGKNRKKVDVDDDNDQMVFLYISVALGFIVGLWGIFIVFLFSKSWRIAYYQFSDVVEDKIIVVVLIWWEKVWKAFFRN